MSDYANPYQPPQGAGFSGPPLAAEEDEAPVPDAILERMRMTRPWVLFLAIFGFLCAGLLAVVGVGMAAMGVLESNRKAPVMIGGGVAYIIMGGFYALPPLGLGRYAASITDLMREPRMVRLATALERQRWFWMVAGIFACVVIVLMALGFFVGVVGSLKR
jgi:hypothetical protein